MRLELLEKIRELHGAPIKLSGGKLYRTVRSLSLEFITNVTCSEGLEAEIARLVTESMPKSIHAVDVKVRKIVAQSEFIIADALNYLQAEHAICSNELDKSCFKVETDSLCIMVKIYVENMAYNHFTSFNIAKGLKEFLERRFIESFEVKFFDTGKTDVDLTLLEMKLNDNNLHIDSIRTFKVDGVTRLFDGDTNDVVSYISDIKDYLGSVYLAGVISGIREMTTKNDKPYFIIDFSDRTGNISGTIFPSKDKLVKMKKLSVGSEIIILGDCELYNGYRNLRIKSINHCCFPKNFVPVARPKRPVPKEYSLIFPCKLVFENQQSFFCDTAPPSCFFGRTFVVFDLETTGVETTDRITEIGAVRIEDGKFVSYFSTLVNPKKHIPKEVVEITGISDEMVQDAPKFSEVCADFYKYCDGATLVAHNIDFDSRFIRREAIALNYHFDHFMMDTLALARECITGVPNYKLNTLCAKFSIEFNHHRAYEDALACAKLFIEIMKIRKEFPF